MCLGLSVLNINYNITCVIIRWDYNLDQWTHSIWVKNLKNLKYLETAHLKMVWEINR